MLMRFFSPAFAPGSTLAALALVTGTLVLGGCSGGSGDDAAAVANREAGSNEDDDAEGDDDLATAVQCAVELQAVAQLPVSETESQVSEESDSPAATSAEHAALADLYRGQAREIGESLAKSPADMALLYERAAAEIATQRKARAPDDYAAWVGGEADECPPLSPDGTP